MKRRALLTAFGVVGTAGCQALQLESDESIRLGTIHLQNQFEREQHVEIEINANEELVHETAVTLDAADPPEVGEVLLEQNWPTEAESYTLRFDADVQPEPLEIVLDEPSVETCESFIITLRPDSIDAFQSTGGECYDER